MGTDGTGYAQAYSKLPFYTILPFNKKRPETLKRKRIRAFILFSFSQQFRYLFAILEGENEPFIFINSHMVDDGVPQFFTECDRQIGHNAYLCHETLKRIRFKGAGHFFSL